MGRDYPKRRVSKGKHRARGTTDGEPEGKDSASTLNDSAAVGEKIGNVISRGGTAIGSLDVGHFQDHGKERLREERVTQLSQQRPLHRRQRQVVSGPSLLFRQKELTDRAIKLVVEILGAKYFVIV